MPASASYLTKYLSAGNSNTNGTTNSGDFEDSTRPKKRRKKDKSSATNNTSTLLIADDDEGLLLSATSNRNEDEDEDPLVYNTNVRSVEFRKKKSSSWRAVQDGGNSGGIVGVETEDQPQRPTQNEANEEQDEATKILNAAAQESAQRTADINDEDAPAIVGEITTDPDPPPTSRALMSSGAPAGLQTAADTAALAALNAQQEQDSSNVRPKKKRKSSPPPQEQETIYRDATGRRIDISLRRAEARAEATAKAAAEKKARDDAMGEVQVREREEAKAQLEEAKYLTVGRDVDDEEMNERLKGEVRWDDPMAGYIAQRNAEREEMEGIGKSRNKGRGDEEEEGVVRSRRRVYAGAAPPNRYGIKPGWRWDGVDRGNGFEKEWFQARGRRTRNENLEYQWAYDE